MKLIVWLGNPGPDYARTRHNAGFLIIDQFVKNLWGERKLDKESQSYIYIQHDSDPEKKILFCKPQTFMNLSGTSVSKLAKFYKIENKNILILHDEIDIPTASIKFKFSGSVAGHNGLKDIQLKLGTPDFARIRIGVDRPTDWSVSDYVLGKFSAGEWEKIEEQYDVIEKMVEDFCSRDTL